MVPTLPLETFNLSALPITIKEHLQPLHEVDRFRVAQACAAREAFVQFCCRSQITQTVTDVKSMIEQLEKWRTFIRSLLQSKNLITSSRPILFQWKDCALDGRFDVYTNPCTVFELAMSAVCSAILKTKYAFLILTRGAATPRDAAVFTVGAITDIQEAKTELKRWTNVVRRAQMPCCLLPGGLESIQTFCEAWRCIAFAAAARGISVVPHQEGSVGKPKKETQAIGVEAECYSSASECLNVARRMTVGLPCVKWRNELRGLEERCRAACAIAMGECVPQKCAGAGAALGTIRHVLKEMQHIDTAQRTKLEALALSVERDNKTIYYEKETIAYATTFSMPVLDTSAAVSKLATIEVQFM